jgi:uncharacterized protein (UPF0332 family)
MPLSYDECLSKGLLRKIPPSKEQGKRSFEKAQRWLDEANAILGSKAFNSAVSAAYLAMFHSARAILFLDGFREKSHVCVARYLAQYVQRGKLELEWVDLLDYHREIRHEDQYDLGFFCYRGRCQKSVRIGNKVYATHEATF